MQQNSSGHVAGSCRIGIAIDFETSGYYGHSACAIGMTRIVNQKLDDEFYSLIRPPSSKIYFTHVHGLRWRDLENAPTFEELWPKIEKFIYGADFFVAHNAVFDRRVLTSCCEAFCCPDPKNPFLCTLKGSRRALAISSHSLATVCEYFGVEIQHHNAASDAYGCARIYLKLKKLGIDDSQMSL